MAHCATLVELADGSLLAAWYAGAYETAPDAGILASRYQPLKDYWSKPQLIALMPHIALGQPVLWLRADGALYLFFNAVMGESGANIPGIDYRNLLPEDAYWDWTTAQPFCQHSLDNGRSWTPPQQILDYPGLMFRSRPLILQDRVILPVYDERTWQSRMLISDDNGRSWRLSSPIATPTGNIHPCLVQINFNHLLAYLRPGGKGGFIWRTESTDGGETWAEPISTKIPNPNSGLDLLRLASGRLVLANNPSTQQRTPLCVVLADADEQWQRIRILEDAAAEFSYPTLLQTRDGRIHIVYTYRRKHIQYACFTEDWLKEGSNYDRFQSNRDHRPDGHAV